MAAVTPTKSLLHSSSSFPKSSFSSKTQFNSISFKKTQSGLEPIRSKSGNACFSGGEGVSRTRRRTERREEGLVVRCTAEGIERGLLVGGRGQEGKFVVPERFKVVALLACVMCLCNADRVVMSVAIVPLAAKHGWSSSFLGIVQLHESMVELDFTFKLSTNWEMVMCSGMRSTVLCTFELSDHASDGSDLISAMNGSRSLVVNSEVRITLHTTNPKSA
ncbi:hypothetical protein RHMOL_Rhmol04G0274500 [Rhododendron molle]|uniref:Uncharacterized protein n=1 Tax=Rhododendron molle TaxID=49168 RepID=A0ACC0P4R9_RHOML|nr:hypothetical protein RHMOL_Rhmol04G0274500 [Rhododendron molle]